MLEDEFADFDYHIMVVDAGANAMIYDCLNCYMCIGCQEPGCVEFGGPADYPCDAPLTECDVKEGAGVTITGNFGASNKRCELATEHRYITTADAATLEESFTVHRHARRGPEDAGGDGGPMVCDRARRCSQRRLQRRGSCGRTPCSSSSSSTANQDSLSPGTPASWYDALVPPRAATRRRSSPS
jgi:hypothetical protein